MCQGVEDAGVVSGTLVGDGGSGVLVADADEGAGALATDADEGAAASTDLGSGSDNSAGAATSEMPKYV